MNEGISLFNEVLHENLVRNKRFLAARPTYIAAFAKLSRSMKKQAAVREALLEREDLVVPPVLIISVTERCNLQCAGCYACAQPRKSAAEMDTRDITRTVSEAAALGVSVVLFAGGEPLMKPGLLDIPQNHPEMLFVLFTNGTLAGDEVAKTLRRARNLILVFSVEGSREITDQRRGAGVFDIVAGRMRALKKQRSLFGASVTVTRQNFSEVIRGEYIEALEAAGCRALFLIEYVPADGDFNPCLTEAQKKQLCRTAEAFAHESHMLIVPLPGDEDKYGGCLAAGRGFAHINSSGALEACPFAPYSDSSIAGASLKTALRSSLLRDIRDNHHLLREGRGGCVLRENEQWVRSLLAGKPRE